MSWMRRVKATVITGLMEQVALHNHWRIKYNAKPLLINEECDLVLNGTVGVKDDEVIYDSDYVQDYQEVMEGYLQHVLSTRGYSVESERQGRKVIMRVGR